MMKGYIRTSKGLVDLEDAGYKKTNTGYSIPNGKKKKKTTTKTMRKKKVKIPKLKYDNRKVLPRKCNRIGCK